MARDGDSQVQHIKRQLALNVTAAVRASYGERDGKPLKGSKASVLRETGISRTTLLSLMDPSSERGVDLNTLQQVAEYLEIPLPYLLMGPADWKNLLSMIAYLDQALIAAQDVIPKEGRDNPAQGIQVLKAARMHPDHGPYDAPDNPQAKAALNERNLKRERRCRILTAMLQPGAKGDHVQLKNLTALAASLGYELTLKSK
jgi:hypothetical protein